MTVEQMKLHYGIVVETVSNINDQAFLDNLQAHHIDAGISLRCYQRFRSSIINFFSFPPHPPKPPTRHPAHLPGRHDSFPLYDEQ